MNFDIQASQFANLLEIASLSALNGEIYEYQEKLIKLFRERKMPFLATMPMRHRVKCAECRVESGESIYHFENPAVKASIDGVEIMWGRPVGLWVQVKTEELHQVLAHKAKPSEALQKVFESVNS
ncbi:MAG: hypothetical protein P9E67_15350 [Candidatus Competibacter sp.]|nr:hypothetical protein [Candidatus Competibacter sp.]